LLRLYKRPIPLFAKDIGNWMSIIELLSYLSIFSNLGLLIFSSNTYSGLETSVKLILFSGLSVFYCVCKVVLDRLLPDIPRKVNELRIRFKYINDKLKKIYLKKEVKYKAHKNVDFYIYTADDKN